jgi:pimeloyl-ACP methyl ester carboxylesterase
LLPGSQVTTVAKGGHFLPLDRPQELNDVILRFARR